MADVGVGEPAGMPCVSGCVIVWFVVEWFGCIIHYRGKGLAGWGDEGGRPRGLRGGWRR